MADQGIAARSRFLNESAHLLDRTSPAISRHLTSQLHSLAQDLDLSLPDAQKGKTCAACGNLMITGWTSRTYINNGTSNSSLKRSFSRRAKGDSMLVGRGNERMEKNLTYECLVCNRKTRQPLPAPIKSHSKKQEHTLSSRLASTTSKASEATQLPTGPGTKLHAPASNNASSKRRAKARKQSGLQAVLAKSKGDGPTGASSTGFGLDLMDFMKSG